MIHIIPFKCVCHFCFILKFCCVNIFCVKILQKSRHGLFVIYWLSEKILLLLQNTNMTNFVVYKIRVDGMGYLCCKAVM